MQLADSLNILAHLAGFEPATTGFVVRCSIQMSYRCSGDSIYSKSGLRTSSFCTKIRSGAFFHRQALLRISLPLPIRQAIKGGLTFMQAE